MDGLRGQKRPWGSDPFAPFVVVDLSLCEQQGGSEDDLEEDQRWQFVHEAPPMLPTLSVTSEPAWPKEWSMGDETRIPATDSPACNFIPSPTPEITIPDFDIQQEIFQAGISSVANQLDRLWLENPYADNETVRHKSLRTQTDIRLNGGHATGYIKFTLRSTGSHEWRNKRPKLIPGAVSVGVQFHAESPREDIRRLPPAFGRVKMSHEDNQLFNFYKIGYCRGRTLLQKTNFWLNEIASMQNEPVVLHAILALAGSYVLDYVRNDRVRTITNDHYRKASQLISEWLRQPDALAAGKGDSIIMAVLLLVVDDCVNWELRRKKDQVPNWYRGAHLAKAILDQTDLGRRYWKSENVQCDKVRIASANWAAFACILGQAVEPLSLQGDERDRRFGWLLDGTYQEVRTIHGGTGLSPKLLHILGQITDLSASLANNPDSVAAPVAAAKIQKLLQNFRQRSELSEGYDTTAALLNSCELDSNGKVNSAVKVTELTGETWVCATKIYLHCRFFRKPRCHPDVREALQTLITCVQRMPCSGDLFTSQAPFFCVFIMAVVSYLPEDRAAARDWFETVLSDVTSRSSVRPVWECVQVVWQWADSNLLHERYFVDSIPIGQRRAWWEDMIDYVIKTKGRVSLT